MYIKCLTGIDILCDMSHNANVKGDEQNDS